MIGRWLCRLAFSRWFGRINVKWAIPALIVIVFCGTGMFSAFGWFSTTLIFAGWGLTILMLTLVAITIRSTFCSMIPPSKPRKGKHRMTPSSDTQNGRPQQGDRR